MGYSLKLCVLVFKFNTTVYLLYSVAINSGTDLLTFKQWRENTNTDTTPHTGDINQSFLSPCTYNDICTVSLCVLLVIVMASSSYVSGKDSM